MWRLVVVLAGCGVVPAVVDDAGITDAGEPVVDAGVPDAGPAGIDFATSVFPLLAGSCSSCHPTGNADGAFAWLRGTVALSCDGPRIVVGQGEASFVVHKLRGTQGCGEQMPQGCSPGVSCFSDPEIATLSTWIDQGANR